MKSDATKLASLSAVIEHDLAAIVKLDNQLSQLLEELQGENPSFPTGAATAYILHNLYNALENSFTQIERRSAPLLRFADF